MKRRGLKIIISLSIALGILLFFPEKTDQQYFFTTEWKTKIPDSFVFGDSFGENAPAFPFTGQNMFGYLSEEGAIAYSEPVVFEIAASSDYFINYSSVSETLLIKNPAGEIVSTIAAVGFPFIRNERLFLLDVDRCGISEWDFSGEKLWEKRYSSIITCFDCNNSEALVGLMNGNILLYNREGEYLYRDEFTGSRVPIVYGLAISSSGAYFAVIQGLDPQQLMLFQRREEGYVPAFSKENEHPVRREIFLQFGADEAYLFIEQDEMLSRLAVRRKTVTEFPLAGRPFDVAYSRAYRSHFIHSGNRKQAAVDMYSEGGMHIGRFYINPESSVTFLDNSFFLQRGEYIHLLSIQGADR